MGRDVVTSDFLFAQPSVLSGIARLLDLWGTFDVYNVSRTAQEADARALRCDWAVVGHDLSHAMAHFRHVPEQGELFVKNEPRQYCFCDHGTSVRLRHPNDEGQGSPNINEWHREPTRVVR